jgi:hypothetical protein
MSSPIGPPSDALAETPQLRPLGVGDIVDRVFAVYRSRPLLFLAIAAAPYLVLVLIITGFVLVSAASFIGIAKITDAAARGGVPDPAAVVAAFGSIAGFLLAIVVVSVVILSAQSAALVDAMAHGYLGRQITLGRAFRDGLAASPSVIGAGLLVFFGIIAFWAVLIVAAVVSQQALVVLGVVLLAVVGTVYIAASTLVAPVVATIERVGPATALRRSWRLSEGNRWRILGLELLLLIINGVISALLSTVLVTSFISDINTRTIVQQIANVIATVAWAPVQWGTFAVLYYDLRVRHEAFDLQLAAEALPRTP